MEDIKNLEDLIVDIDSINLDDNDKQVKEPITKRDKQLKRWFVTLNHPFWDETMQEEDISNCDLPIKYDYYDYSYIKGINNIDMFEFHFVKVKTLVDKIQTKTILEKDENGDYKEQQLEQKIKEEQEFIVERPYFRNYECLQQYIENLQIEGLKYAVGQIEKGHEGGNVHLQAGLIFETGKRFYTMKKYLPTARLDMMRGKNYECKVYCTKEDTRLMPPFEIGTFREKGERGDFEDFFAAIRAGATNVELMEQYSSIVARMGIKNVDAFRNEYLAEYYKSHGRNVEVTFIYGPPGVGKTKSVYKQNGFNNVFSVSTYGQFAFHGYKNEKVLLLDEFLGKIEISVFNKVLDPYPYDFEIKGGRKVACHDKVYIISNKSFFELYKYLYQNDGVLYKAMERRLHHIFRVDENGKFIREKETIFEEIPENEIELEGWTKRICKVVRYNAQGVPHVDYDLHNGNTKNYTLEPIEDENVDSIFGGEQLGF